MFAKTTVNIPDFHETILQGVEIHRLTTIHTADNPQVPTAETVVAHIIEVVHPVAVEVPSVVAVEAAAVEVAVVEDKQT